MPESIADFKARIAQLMKDVPLEQVTNIELHRWRRAVVKKSYYPPSNKPKGKQDNEQ
jgi:hypothetical protein